MKEYSRIISVLLSLLLILFLSGCGRQPSAERAAENTSNDLMEDQAENNSNSTQENTEGLTHASGESPENLRPEPLPSQLLYLTMYSEALEQEMNLNIYLPAGYSSKEKYPVLYMIHGYTGDQNVWLPGLKLEQKADQLIEDGKIQPVVIVSPDIDNSYGINSSETTRQLGSNPSNSLNEGMYEDYLINDVISYVDSNYSTMASKEGRYIGGLSMGGCTALHLAFAHTDMFSKAGGHSPALFLDEFPGGLEYWLYPDESARRERDPIYIAKEKDISSMEVYLDCGSEDSYEFYEGCEELQRILQEKGVKSQYHLNTGEHDGQYWMDNSEDYLLFYAGK